MDIINKACCYLITNTINNKKYVGVTTNFNSRMANHKYNANIKLKSDIKEFGWKNFSKEILFYGTEAYCYSKEEELINKYNSEYNIARGGLHGSVSMGISNGNSKFTDNQIKQIRLDYATKNYTMVVLANKYGAHNSYISEIISGNFRLEAGGPISTESKVKILVDKDVIEIRELYRDTRLSYTIIAKKYKVGKTNIGKIIRGERWKNSGGPIKGVDYGI